MTHPVLRCSACDMIMLQSASKRLSFPLCRLKQQDLLGTALQLLEQPCAAAQVLLNSMLKVEQARLDAAHDSSTNGHASASEEENRPKPCVPKAEQIRVHSGAPHSAESVKSMPQGSTSTDMHTVAAGSSMKRKAFKMEWDFSQHAMYPVMRLKQNSSCRPL